MTPRQRVLTALNHTEPDRVPIDLAGHRSSGMAAIAYAKLRDPALHGDLPLKVCKTITSRYHQAIVLYHRNGSSHGFASDY